MSQINGFTSDTSHALPLPNVFRADEVRPSLSAEQALAGAPAVEDGQFIAGSGAGVVARSRPT